ncbi:pseudouridine-5'-phosphate glycosidase [Actinomycetospora cinnamomea]|uniref:Pseudouridine-5'-phosphate glycosidase n=1 Tax=Actinomycetospora cinnamomea TaxID=663609 RepID=A0A2U1E7U9_9PSEU|nr:pseudouridine-5'-phosphate glycosidase [Actinomycetospora cinnamomea]
MSSSPVRVSEEVRDAVAEGRPVVALESTIVTHGLPRPRNLAVAADAEAALRATGAVPATIGVVDGRPVVGLGADELARLAADTDVEKLSVRDLPVAVARGACGGTTVAATALLARRAGVGVFATCGLGGVHRGASTTFDESADLVALSGVPILVVSAGVKSILDVPATLERLETLNVTVLGYRTDSFPGFYVRDAGVPVPARVDTPEEAAAVVRARDALGLRAAVVLANPIAAEEQLDVAEHRAVLDAALTAAADRGVVGHDTTPFLLERMRDATEGRSLEVNVAVYRGNVAALAAAVAGALAAPP